MDKRDCRLGMFVSVFQNTSSLPRNRSRIKRIGKIVGIYNNYVNLLLYKADFADLENIIIKRKLYIESFRFYEISEIDKEMIKWVS